MYFGSFGNNNICLRGNNSSAGTLNPSTQAGFFNHALVTCFSWPSWTTTDINAGKSSWSVATIACVGNAAWNGGNQPQSTNGSASYARNQDRPFAANITAGTGMSSVRYTSWNSKAAAASYQGYVNIGMSNRSNAMGLSGVVAYGFSFSAWRNVTNSGTILTTVLSTNLFAASNYGGINFKDINTMVATAS